jgi:hypothetical protein
MTARATSATKAASGGCGCGGHGGGGHHGCGCGCGCTPAPGCCDLECLARPSFFCGQLLTDADLGAMVSWARARFGLARHRDGWGVVCGLDVTCAPPQGDAGGCCGDDRPRVWVGAGYAVDCCGNDLVVCEPIPVDLGDVCQPQVDLCGQLPPPQQKPKEAPQEEVPFRGGALVAVDLWLRYGEDLARGQRALFRGACADVDACEYTRVLERPTVHAERADPKQPPPGEPDAQAWLRQLARRAADQRDRIARAARDAGNLVAYAREFPPYRLCFLRDEIRAVAAGGEGVRELLPRLGHWLTLDWLFRELACPCPSCRSDEGVLLARVLLRRPARRDEPCRVVLVDAAPPFRRPLRKDPCRPIPPGAIDLVPHLWRPLKLAGPELLRLGVKVVEPVGLEQAAKELGQPRFWLEPGGAATAVAVLDDNLDQPRIVGFA